MKYIQRQKEQPFFNLTNCDDISTLCPWYDYIVFILNELIEP